MPVLSVLQILSCDYAYGATSQCAIPAIHSFRGLLQVLQSIAWKHVAPRLPKGLQIRLALVVLAVYRGATTSDPAESSFWDWIWNLFDGPVGTTLTAFPQVKSYSLLLLHTPFGLHVAPLNACRCCC